MPAIRCITAADSPAVCWPNRGPQTAIRTKPPSTPRSCSECERAIGLGTNSIALQWDRTQCSCSGFCVGIIGIIVYRCRHICERLRPSHDYRKRETQMEEIERILWHEQALCYIIRSEVNPARTTFLTPPEFKQQVGFVVYPAGGTIMPHLHLPLERHLVGTSEVLIIKRGRCLLDVYNDNKELVATRELHVGDIMLMVGGGHGFRMLEDTVFLEIKQGPYLDMVEKERFQA
jgi:hypothetical protein